jgi:Skp family chaperone for outer membrane proteins
MKTALYAAALMTAQAALAATPPAVAPAVAAPAAAAAPIPPPPAPAAQLPAPPPATTGPLITGVCLFSQEQLITRSKVGQAATARLRELGQQAQANLTGEKSRLEARAKALEAKRAALSPLQFQQQAEAINQRQASLQAEAQQRGQQLDATKTMAFNQVLLAAKPFTDAAYAAHGCGLLLSREAVLGGNLGNDLTPEVIAAMDAKGTPITFDLAPLPGK